MRKKFLKLFSIAVVLSLGFHNISKADSLTGNLNGSSTISSVSQQLLSSYLNSSASNGFYQTMSPQYYEGSQYVNEAGQLLNNLNLQSLAQNGLNFNFQGLTGGNLGSVFSQGSNLQGIIGQLANGNLANLATTSEISQAPMTLLSFASPTVANSMMNMQQQATKVYSTSSNTYQNYLNKSSVGKGVTAQGTSNAMVTCIQQNTQGGMDLNSALSKCSSTQLSPQYVPLTANNNSQLTSGPVDLTQQSAQLANFNQQEQSIYNYYVGDISINNNGGGSVQMNTTQNPVLSAYNDYTQYYGSMVMGAMNDPTNTNNVTNYLQQIAYQTGATITPDLLIKLHNSPNGSLFANQIANQIAILRVQKDMQLVNTGLDTGIQKAKSQGNTALAKLLEQRQITLAKQFTPYKQQDPQANIAQIANATIQQNTENVQNVIANPTTSTPGNSNLVSSQDFNTMTSDGNSTGTNALNSITNSVTNLVGGTNNSTYNQTLQDVQKWNH